MAGSEVEKRKDGEGKSSVSIEPLNGCFPNLEAVDPV